MATKDSFPGWCSIIYTLSPLPPVTLTEGTHINPNRHDDFKMGTYNIFSTRSEKAKSSVKRVRNWILKSLIWR